MRKFIRIFAVFSCFFIGFCDSSYAITEEEAFAVLFENKETIPNFSAVAIKNLSKSETVEYKRREFTGVRRLIAVLGEIEPPERKIRFTAHYRQTSG